MNLWNFRKTESIDSREYSRISCFDPLVIICFWQRLGMICLKAFAVENGRRRWLWVGPSLKAHSSALKTSLLNLEA